MSIPELSLVLVMAGLTGLGGLALVMGTALSSVAELLALLLRTDGWVGSCGSPPGTDVRPSGVRRPYDRALFRAVAAWQDENGSAGRAR